MPEWPPLVGWVRIDGRVTKHFLLLSMWLPSAWAFRKKKGRNKMHSFKEQVSDTCFSLHPFGDWGGVAFADVCSTCSGCYTWDWGGERRFRQVPEKRLETTLLFAPSCFCLRVVLPESPDVTTHILQILWFEWSRTLNFCIIVAQEIAFFSPKAPAKVFFQQNCCQLKF